MQLDKIIKEACLWVGNKEEKKDYSAYIAGMENSFTPQMIEPLLMISDIIPNCHKHFNKQGKWFSENIRCKGSHTCESKISILLLQACQFAGLILECILGCKMSAW